MCNIGKHRVSITFILLFLTILTALPAAAQPPKGILHEKSALGLMPPAYVLDPDAATPAMLASVPYTGLGSPVSSTTGSSPELVTAGIGGLAVATSLDFDPDNDQQLQRFVWGTGRADLAQRLAGSSDPQSMAVLDVNHDGLPDLVLASRASNELLVYPGGPGGTLAEPERISVAGGPEALAVADVTGDLREDLVVILPDSDTIALWASGPEVLRRLPESLPFPSDGYTALAIGDFDNNGEDDIAALRGSGVYDEHVLVFFQSAGDFSQPLGIEPKRNGFLPHAIAAGDVNEDGGDDLVVVAGGNAPNAFLSVYLQTVTGLSAQAQVYDAYDLPGSVQIFDLNHDGRPDVVAAHDGWRALGVFLQNGTRTLEPYSAAELPYSSHFKPQGMGIADVTGDGGGDVFVVSREGGLTILPNLHGAPTAVIVSPVNYANVPFGQRMISGTTSAGTTAVEVRVRGLTGWMPATLSGTNWSISLELPETPRSWWIEARAINSAGRYQAPPARHRVYVLGRVRDGLVVEYHFDETEGTALHDRSNVGEPLDLTLADEQAVSRVPEGYFVNAPTRIASTGAAQKVFDALSGSNEFSLEIWIRTANLKQEGPARIMTLSEDSPHLNFSLVQSRFGGEAARIGLRLNTSTPPAGKNWYEQSAELPLTTDLNHIVVTRAADGTVIFYINGVEHGRGSMPGDFSSWNEAYGLLLANDALAERPWLGEYHLAAIYQRALAANEVIQNFTAGPIGDGSAAQITDAQVVYTFNEGSGDTVGDSALVLPALPATISDPSAVSWGDGNLAVNSSTLIATELAATKVNHACIATNEIAIEAWVTPENTAQNGPARIATISENTSLRNVTLAQGLWGNQPSDLYLARLRSTATSPNGEPHLNTPAGTLTPELTHVVYTRDSTGRARLFINGIERASRQVSGDLSNWEADYRLALANEFTMNRTWLGTYHFLAIYSRALNADQIQVRYQIGPEGNGSRPPSAIVGPFVQRVTINGGASTTTTGDLTLDIDVRVPSGRTLNRITVAEYGFDQARRGWALLQRGAPMPSAATAEAQSAAYRWQLKPGAGVRFLQIWATDSTGAVTSYPYQTFINLVPESTRVDRGKVDVYRFALHAGEQFDVQLTSTSGDADLAIWGPIGDTSMRWVSNSRGGTDQVTLVAPVDGVYQVEVRGYTRADYRLSTVVEVAAVLSGTSLANVFNTAEVVDDKPLPEAPAISVDDAPALENDQSLRVFLPLIRR